MSDASGWHGTTNMDMILMVIGRHDLRGWTGLDMDTQEFCSGGDQALREARRLRWKVLSD